MPLYIIRKQQRKEIKFLVLSLKDNVPPFLVAIQKWYKLDFMINNFHEFYKCEIISNQCSGLVLKDSNKMTDDKEKKQKRQ